MEYRDLSDDTRTKLKRFVQAILILVNTFIHTCLPYRSTSHQYISSTFTNILQSYLVAPFLSAPFSAWLVVLFRFAGTISVSITTSHLSVFTRSRKVYVWTNRRSSFQRRFQLSIHMHWFRAEICIYHTYVAGCVRRRMHTLNVFYLLALAFFR